MKRALLIAATATACFVQGCASYRYNGPQLHSVDSLCRAKTDGQPLAACIEQAFEGHDKKWRSDPDYPYIYSYITFINTLDKHVASGAITKDASYTQAMQYMNSLAQQKAQNEANAANARVADALTISTMASILSAGATLYSVATPPRQQICNWHKVGNMWQQICN